MYLLLSTPGLSCCSRRSKAVAFIGHKKSRVSQIVPGLLVIWWHETCGAVAIGRLNFGVVRSSGIRTVQKKMGLTLGRAWRVGVGLCSVCVMEQPTGGIWKLLLLILLPPISSGSLLVRLMDLVLVLFFLLRATISLIRTVSVSS